MGFILGLFIFLALFKPVSRWLIKTFLRWQMRKYARRAANAYGFTGQEPPRRRRERHNTREHQQPSQPAPKKKKITSDVGEYVVFEDISEERVPRPPAEFQQEVQVSDAEWEELG